MNMRAEFVMQALDNNKHTRLKSSRSSETTCSVRLWRNVAKLSLAVWYNFSDYLAFLAAYGKKDKFLYLENAVCELGISGCSKGVMSFIVANGFS
jgi:hypothetical protein